jgi:hypothetical protein
MKNNYTYVLPTFWGINQEQDHRIDRLQEPSYVDTQRSYIQIE